MLYTSGQLGSFFLFSVVVGQLVPHLLSPLVLLTNPLCDLAIFVKNNSDSLHTQATMDKSGYDEQWVQSSPFL